MPPRIVAELQALGAETRRKHPEVRQAADRVLQQLQESDSDAALAALRSDPAAEHALVQPIVLASKTRAPKVVLIALSLLQHCVMLHLIPERALPQLVDMLHALLGSVARTDVDVQLKILQTVPALLTEYPTITSKLLASTLMLCFSLYEHARVSVVSSTAAATLRQNIMTVFDKVHAEDRVFDAIKHGGEDAAAAAPLPVHTAHTPDGPVTLFPCSADAYFVLSDLCALANHEPASFLPLQSLTKPFVLELLESVLTNHAQLFALRTPYAARHGELLYVLRSAACPFLLKALSEPPIFSVLVRIMRLVLLLLRQFSEELVLEIEILLRMVLKTARGERGMPLWHRVLALEVVRNLCADGFFMRRLYRWYDAGAAGPHDAPGTPLFADMVETLRASTAELHAHLSVDEALAAACELRPEASPTSSASDRKTTLYGAASAAVAGMRTAAEGLLSTRPEPFAPTSAPAIPLLDQLDKTEAPPPGSAPLPTTYAPLLVLWAQLYLAQSLALHILRRYAEVYAETQTAPPPLAHAEELACTVAMLETFARPATEALTFFLTVHGPPYLFDQALLALHNLGIAAGVVNCTKASDRILHTLADLALPSAALHDPRALGARNYACQCALASAAVALAGTLGSQWRAVLMPLAQAHAVAPGQPASPPSDARARRAAPQRPIPPGVMMGEARDTPLNFLAPTYAEAPPAAGAALRRVLTHSVCLANDDFFVFATCLAELTADAVRGAWGDVADVLLTQLEYVALLNTSRIAAQLPEGAWVPCVATLFALMEHPASHAAYRTHAAAVLDAVAYSVLRAVPSTAHARQRTILAAVERQACAQGCATPTDLAIRQAAIELLQHMLETHAHRLQAGWDVIFGMCRAVAEAAPAMRAHHTVPGPLLKGAFACVQRICSDHIVSLSDAELKLGIESLTCFSTRSDDTNLALAANGVLWDIAADVHRRQTAADTSEHAANLWLFVLHRMRVAADVPQADVRNGALANLFQVLVQYSGTLPSTSWHRIFSEIVLVLYDAHPAEETHIEARADSGEDAWDTSRTLLLQGTARLLESVLPTLANDTSFPSFFAAWLARVEELYSAGTPPVAQAALDALLKVVRTPFSDAPLLDAWRGAWSTWKRLCAVQRFETTPSHLVALVALQEALYTALHDTLADTEHEALVQALEQSAARGIAHSSTAATKQLYALVGGVHRALERLPRHARMAALRLHALATLVECALDASAAPHLAPPLRALRVQLAEDLLLHWQSTYLADARNPTLYDATLPDAPVLRMLVVLRAPLQTGDMHAPSLASLARETLYHLSHCGTSVVSHLADKQPLPTFYAHLFACMRDVLQAQIPPLARTQRDALEAQAFALLATLEQDVLPAAGADPAAHEALKPFLADAVAATQLHTRAAADFQHGTLCTFEVRHQERFVYWTWDLLFALCAAPPDAPVGRRLLAVLTLPPLLARCAEILQAFASDTAVRGRMPLPRVRVEEVNYVLYQLQTLALAPGCLATAMHTRDAAAACAALQTYEPPTSPLPLPETLQHMPCAHLFFLQRALDAAACGATQHATVGTSLPPLDPAQLGEVDAALIARATRVPPVRTTPAALVQQTQARRSAALG